VTPAELAQVFEMVAAAIRSGHFPASATPAAAAVAAPATPTRTLSAWLDVHEQQILGKGYKVQTIRNRRANLNHVRRLWGDSQIDTLRAHEIITKLRAEFLPVRTSTAQRVLAELRDAFNEAIANDWATTNPAAHVKLPTHRVKRKRLSFEVWEQMRELARAGRQPWLESLLLLALVTGQRRGDLVKMQFGDVVDGHLQVEQQKQAGKGHGARIAIPLFLRLDAIGMTLGDVIEDCRSAGATGQTLVRKAGGDPLEESSLSIKFAECIRAVCGADAYGTDEWPSLHEVRSLSARMYRAQGIDVQTLLGHKHAEMTALYEDDRGLSAGVWKRLPVPVFTTNPMEPRAP
jgi:integrase